jgi:hypothetical protein
MAAGALILKVLTAAGSAQGRERSRMRQGCAPERRAACQKARIFPSVAINASALIVGSVNGATLEREGRLGCPLPALLLWLLVRQLLRRGRGRGLRNKGQRQLRNTLARLPAAERAASS